MANTTITMRIDEKIKTELQDLMSDLGLDVTTYFTMAAKQAIRTQSIPFNTSRETPNAETLAAFQEVEDMKRNLASVKSYSSFSELLKEVEQDV